MRCAWPGLAQVTGRSSIRDEMLNGIPAGRIREPDEIAEPIAFLASDAPSYISDAVITRRRRG